MTNHTALDTDTITALLQDAADSQQGSLDSASLLRLLEQAGLPVSRTDTLSGNTLSLRLKNTREFGPVISVGLGGDQGELLKSALKKGQHSVTAAADLTQGDDLLDSFRQTLAYRQLDEKVSDQALMNCFDALIMLARYYAPNNSSAPFILDELTLNPCCFDNGHLLIESASCQFSEPKAIPAPRPVEKIAKMLHPKSIGIIGVSGSKMNFGRIILKNILASGYPAEQLTIIRPNEEEIDGVKCVESLSALEQKLDLFVVAIAADAVFDLVDEVIATQAAEAVMLIPGGLGETAASREQTAAMMKRINDAHRSDAGGPVFLGGNCLGIVSHPGEYDTWFIPKNRLPQGQKKQQRNSALISQSGAFMITRISNNPWLDPAYMTALGNQNDLTHGDMVNYFADQDEIKTIGVYSEGFRDLDGLTFAKAVRKATLLGKQVVLYKAGRSIPGAMAAMGHTASIAGDFDLCESVITQAGGIVSNDFDRFNDLFYIAGCLHDKTIGGNRLGAVSGAGFEAVGMADNIHVDNFSLEVPTLSPQTEQRIAEILKAKRLDALMEVRNPMDINPGADDEAHLQCAEAFANDPDIDAVVVGLDPMSPVMRTLVENKLRPGYDTSDEQSIAHQMPKMVKALEKPLIGIVDGGALYDPLVAQMMDQGVCVFRSCGRGVQALSRYTQARLSGEQIRKRFG
ncbi:CoA-binding protein [Sedimenticola selenatireducens]|uniref:CoA-binding protein n=1 Tax=Sedimenticola selenatireducens TaxID=191960 RepID=A0A558DY27_9GAMM|nr:CoA-binding protein [Sedimenticola selenatireducens]TVO70967.1 CoA-binding protein [Sedimenticola selenatireducens]TVT65833.1 MAG: CoA-binding protein [Sedimenticola selenatireducens]